MRTWILRETGEIRRIVHEDYYNPDIYILNGDRIEHPYFTDTVYFGKYPILSLEVHDSYPTEGVREVLKEYEEMVSLQQTLDSLSAIPVLIHWLNRFLGASRKAVEGK